MYRWQGGHWSFPASSLLEADQRWCWAGSSRTHEHPAACSYQKALWDKQNRYFDDATSSAKSPDVSAQVGTNRSPCVAVWWTFWVGWHLLSSSGWQYCGTGQPDRWAGSPFVGAGCGMPGSSPGRAGRSKELGAQSCSSMCSQTK